ncbi:TadE/TadG family type IV pilus assembly protein [Rhizobium sp. G21]|uniref:TadE/TadG family type IV pilus assembly protein n=1 Tax=Rhizobium sp. G21 TaxID=2758439 RepID=UPI00160198CF|nr:TadE/TadG family type IV pilus assembly protein [Rhizobium sp. G21]MBB1249408.1 pilus assembly protein [Rhizobium sp. G21]
MLGDRFLKKARRVFGGFRRASDGAAAIEFAILILPFAILVFAIFETFTAFAGETLVNNAVDTMARRIRTGEITFGQGKSTDMTEAEFRQAFCDEIAVFHMCDDAEAATPAKLYIDVRQFASYSAMPLDVPKISSAAYSDLDTSDFAFSPGGADSKNMLRAYYRWSVMTDLVRPYVANLKPSGEARPTQFLIVATSVFENEDYE